MTIFWFVLVYSRENQFGNGCLEKLLSNKFSFNIFESLQCLQQLNYFHVRYDINERLTSDHLIYIEGVVAQWYNPLTLQPVQSEGVGSMPGRAPPLEHHEKGSRTQLALSYFCNPSAWC